MLELLRDRGSDRKLRRFAREDWRHVHRMFEHMPGVADHESVLEREELGFHSLLLQAVYSLICHGQGGIVTGGTSSTLANRDPVMKRRSFMQASVAGALAAASAVTAADPERKAREHYELRIYTLKPARLPLLEHYLSKAFLPTLKRYALGPVGVFIDKANPEQTRVYVLIVYSSPDQCTSLSARLADDAEYKKLAADYLAAPAADPVYSRIESSLLTAIDGMPRLEKADPSKPRLFNLRVYESHNERAGKKKIEMFNKGELAIFRRVGLTPVFFGETIVGGAMPNLTYLLTFPDEDGRKAAWNKFRDDPEWLKLKAIPDYADKEIVSRITNIILAPAAYSEI